jgi:AcrR family transcriptional regulator
MSPTKGSPEAKREARNKRRRKQTRAEILDATRAVILEQGLDKFSLSAVADELGLTKPALYYYFSSKETLIFEVVLRELLDAGAEIEEAVNGTDNGADAVEAMMRTCFDRYRDHLDLYILAWKMIPPGEWTSLVGPDGLDRIRPLNQMTYGGTQERIAADQERGDFPADRNPRLFTFNAHMAVLGILNMMAIAESANDPLIHGDDALIDDICRTFRAAARTTGDN